MNDLEKLEDTCTMCGEQSEYLLNKTCSDCIAEKELAGENESA